MANQRSSFDVLGSGGNQMGAQICTLHGSSTNSTVASAHSLMSLRTLAAQSYRSFSSSLISEHMAVPADAKLASGADVTLTKVCRLAVVVNSRSV